jgi:uncharacterized protein
MVPRPVLRAAAATPARKAWLYLALAIGWSWLLWLAAIAIGRPFADPGTVALFIVGGAGVPGAALFLLFAADDAAARRDYWVRLIDTRRLGLRGMLLAGLLPPAVALSAAATYALHTGAWPDFVPLRSFLTAPLALLLFLVFMLAFGPLPEELGWRGYALDHLQSAYGPLAAALILGSTHAAWHLPLFFFEGSYQHWLGAFTPAFWRSMASIVALSVVMTWLFNRTGRSTLSAILLHYSDNLTGELLHLPDLAEWYRLALYLLLALALAAVSRGELARRDSAR